MADKAVFTFEGKKFHLGDMTLAEVERVEDLTGTIYVGHNPMGQMSHKKAYMSVFLLRDHSDDQVVEIISKITRSQVDEMWSYEPDDLPEIYQDGFPS